MSAQPVENTDFEAAVARGVAAALPAAMDTYIAANAFGIVKQMDTAREQIAKAKTFIGTVTDVKKEQSSTRGVITLFTNTEQARDGLPAGHEQVRTDRTDSGVAGKALALKARSLIGHRVLVHVEIEEYQGKNGPGKVRVLRHLEDLGVPS